MEPELTAPESIVSEPTVRASVSSEPSGSRSSGPGGKVRTAPVPVNNGSPRITVAFPFSRITISQPDPALQTLLGIVHRLAEHTAVLARELDTDEAEALDLLVEEVVALVDDLQAR